MSTRGGRSRFRTFVVAASLAAGLVAPSIARAEEPWRTEDIIDGRIDENAQYALMRMMSRGDIAAHADASAILSAVKNEQLAGVYQADRGVPAKRAQAAGIGWWQIVPRGFDAVCYTGKSGLPMIVYRPGVGPIRERLDPALRGAWTSCGLAAAPPRAYRVTLHKPPPPPPPPPPDLPPAPAAGLTVLVTTTAGAPVSSAQVATWYSDGNGGSADTNSAGVAAFDDVPAGVVDIQVVGPENCTDESSEVIMTEEPMTVTFVLDCTVQTPPAPPQCDADKYAEVFDGCAKNIPVEAAECLKSAYIDYAKCGLDPVCVAEALADLWKCKNELNYKQRSQDCNDEANRQSNCKYKGPLD
jgi:hypothetical protein